MFSRRFTFGVFLGCLVLLVRYAAAAEPAIRNLNVRGLQIGGTTTVVVDGDDLGAGPKLLLPFAAKQELKAGSTDKQATFEVAPEGEIAPGYYQLRVATEQGVSLPVVIAVDRMPQKPLPPATESTSQLPVALHGSIGGSSVLETKFDGKAGQEVRIEIETQRLGGKLRPVLHLYDAKRKQLAWAWGTPTLGGDARVEATLPADGQYIVAIHDLEYSVPGPGFFRLRIGQWAQAEQVFPPRIGVGQSATLELVGLPKPISMPLAAAPSAGTLPVALPGDGLWSGPRPMIEVSTQAQVVEQAAGAVQDLPAAPLIDVSGRLAAPNEEDRYRLTVTPGSKVRLEVFAERLRSPVDVALVVRNEKGDQLAKAEDSPETLDPLLEYTVPDQVTQIVIGVVDAQGRGGPRAIYRLAIDARSPGTNLNDFELVTPAQRLALPKDGRAVVPVWVERRGYDGPIEIAARSLLGGARIENTTIPAGCDGTLLNVVRGEAADGAAIFAWQGKSGDGQERIAKTQDHPLERSQPWLATEVALAATTTPGGDFTLDWRDLPAEAGLVNAGKLTLPIKVTRPSDAAFEKATVRLTLLTSQLPPRQNRQPDTNKMLRVEKPVELAADKLEGEAVVLLPPELPSLSYDLCLQAELLAPDKKVLRTAFTPVRRLPVRNPLAVQLAADKLEAALDAKTGAMIKVEGKIERREGLTGDVMVALTGLPSGLRADNVTVKADATDFTLTLVIPANAKPGPLPPLQLTASGTPDPKNSGVRVKSRDVLLTVLLQPPPPPPDPPK